MPVIKPSSALILLDKRPGMTSFAALSGIKKSLATEKIGHTGTLDSFASGLLVALAGDLTRLAPYVTGLDKTYLAVIAFGAETDTLDPLGEVVAEAALPTLETLTKALPKFIGKTMQEPPAYSAVKIAGKRASDLAREGKGVSLAKRPVTVYAIRLRGITTEKTADLTDAGGAGAEKADRKSKLVKTAAVVVECSSGTYVRSLARDVALECGSRAHLLSLRRTRVGGFSVEDAAGKAMLFSPDLAEKCGLGRVILGKEHEADFFNGKAIEEKWFIDTNGTNHANNAVFLSTGAFAGVVEKDGEGKMVYGFVMPGRKRG
jgi:tRNA pseudouridine55 synthase